MKHPQGYVRCLTKQLSKDWQSHGASGATFPSDVTMDLQKRIIEPPRSVTRGSKVFVVSRKPNDRKKVRGPESPLYTAICPLVYIIRIFGLAPYEFHNDTLVPSNINSIVALVCLIVYIWIICSVMLRFTGAEMSAPLLGHTETLKAVGNFSVAIFDIVVTVFRRKKFVRIWNVMQDYDEIVRNLGYPRTERRTCFWAWILIVMTFLIWLAVNQSGMYAFDEPWLQNVTYMMIYVGSSVSIIKFSGMALLLGQRFHHLNVVAKTYDPLAPRWLLVSPVVHPKDIEYLHNLLMTAGESLDSLYSWSLLFWLGNLCLHVVANLYFVIQRMLKMSVTLKECLIVSCLLSWIASCVGQLILLNFACHFAASEANCMGYILINWKRWFTMRRREDAETTIHLINRRLNFSASGCFSVELPLLQSITAALTTYLVILIQLS